MARDYGAEAQKAAEKRLVVCWEALHAENEGEVGEWPDDMQYPFCGCSTCEIREAFTAAWPILMEAAREEVREQA